MRTFAIAALVAAPVLSKVLAQQYDEGYEEPAYNGGDDYEVASYGAGSAGSYGAGSAGSYGASSGHSYGKSSKGSDDNYSVEDYDQYHNDENNNQSPDTKYASDTTT